VEPTRTTSGSGERHASAGLQQGIQARHRRRTRSLSPAAVRSVMRNTRTWVD